MMKVRCARWVMIAALLLCCRIGSAEVEAESSGSTVDPADMKAPVTVAQCHEGTLEIPIHALGTVKLAPDIATQIVARTSGVVDRLMVHEGDSIKFGDPVAMLDRRNAHAAVLRAEAALQSAKQELDAAQAGGLDTSQMELDAAATKAKTDAQQLEKEAERIAALLADGMASDRALSDAKAAAKAATLDAKLAEARSKQFRDVGRKTELARLKSSVDAAAADRDQARLEEEMTKTSASSSGVVERLHVTPGDHVDPGTVIADLRPAGNLILSLQLSPDEASRIRAGGRVSVDDKTHDSLGTIRFIDTALDPATGLVRAVASLNETTTPLAGSIIPATIESGSTAKGLIVPSGAVSFDEDQAVVALVQGNVAHVVPVDVLARSNGKICVSGEGLGTDTTVIVDGNVNLPDGAGIVVKEAEK